MSNEIVLSWQTIIENSAIIGNKLKEDPIKGDCIIAIAKGGLTLGAVLGNMLSLPVYCISMRSYTNDKQQGEIEVFQSVPVELYKGKNVIVCDDINDTGKTFQYVEDLIQKDAERVSYVSLAVKDDHTNYPDAYAPLHFEGSPWIVFPWEASF